MYKVLEIALDEVGYLEKAANNSLDIKLSNAGKNNYTKFARDLDNIPDFYNGRKQGAAWCDVFVDWCFVKAYGATKAREMLYQPEKSLGAGCLYSANYFKAAGRFFNSPKVGDQIFFTQGEKVTHTGLVYAIDTLFVYTVEDHKLEEMAEEMDKACQMHKEEEVDQMLLVVEDHLEEQVE